MSERNPGRLWLASLDFRRTPRRPVRLANTPIGYRLVLDYDAEALFCAIAPQLVCGAVQPKGLNILDLFGCDVELVPVHWQRSIEPLRYEREVIDLKGVKVAKLADDLCGNFWIVEHNFPGSERYLPHGRVVKWPQIAKVERPRAVQLREIYDLTDWPLIGDELEFADLWDRFVLVRLGRRLHVLQPPWIYRKGDLRPPVTDGHPLANEPSVDAQQATATADLFAPRHPFKWLTWERHQAEILSLLSRHAALINAPIQDADGNDLPWGSRKHGTGRKPAVSMRQLLAALAIDGAWVVARMGKGSKFPVGVRPPKHKRAVRPWRTGEEWAFRDQLDLELSGSILGATAFDPFWDRYAPDRPEHHSPRKLLLRCAEKYRDMRRRLEHRSSWTPNGGLVAWMLRNTDLDWADREALRRIRVSWLHQQRATRDRRRGEDKGGRPWKIQNAINGRWSSWQFPDYVTAELQTVRCRRATGRGASVEDDFPESQDWQEQMFTRQVTSGSHPEADPNIEVGSAEVVIDLGGLTEEQIHEAMGHTIPVAAEPSEKEIEQRARMLEKVRHVVASMRSARGLEFIRLIAEEGHTPAEASRAIGEPSATGRKRLQRLREKVRP